MLSKILHFTYHKSSVWKAKPMTLVWNNMLVRFSHGEPAPSYPNNMGWINRQAIGNRDVVGHGRNGIAGYTDNIFAPFPAIRYKVFEGDLLLLREKEKGCWGDLSKEEKKTLYRSSFRQTFAEFNNNSAYPDSECWSAVGMGLTFVAISLFYYIYLALAVLPPLPTTMTREGWENTITRMIHLRWNPVTGIASYWDYDAERWYPGREPWFLHHLPQNSPLRVKSDK